MPLDLLRANPRPKAAAFRDAKPPFFPLGLASTVILVGLLVLLAGHFLPSALPQLCAAIRCCLLRRYIFVAVNIMILVLVLLKLTDREDDEEALECGDAALAAGEVSPDVWFDALPSPTSFGDVTAENSESTPVSSWESLGDVATKNGEWAPASSVEPVGDVTAKKSESTPASSLEPVGGVANQKSWPTPASSLKPVGDATTRKSESTAASSLLTWANSSSGGNSSDEYSSCPATPSKSPVSSPVHPAAIDVMKPSKEPPAPPVEEEDDDSMDATWKAITGRKSTAPHLKKSSTWDGPPPVKLEPPARGELRKSETFQVDEAAAAAAAARRAVLEKRMKGREVAVTEDHDEMNRRFDAFIKKFNEELRLQRLASLQRRRFMDMVPSAGY